MTEVIDLSQKTVLKLPTQTSEQPLTVGVRISTVPFPKAVVGFIPGHQRSTDEKKFHTLAQSLHERGMASVGLDLFEGHTPCTFEQLVQKLAYAEEWLVREHGLNISRYTAHSLGSCVVLEHCEHLKSNPHLTPRPLVMLAPALNQKTLIRWRFYQRLTDKKTLPTNTELPTPGTWEHFKRSWHNASSYEVLFQRAARLARHNHSLLERDFTPIAISCSDHIIAFYGQEDTTVPYQSIPQPNAIKNYLLPGDHDLENEIAMHSWIPHAIHHLTR